MSAPKWVRDEEWGYWIFRGLGGWDFSIDEYEGGGFQAHYAGVEDAGEKPIGPARKTLKAAHNDCKRHAKKLRAALVMFDRAKLA